MVFLGCGKAIDFQKIQSVQMATDSGQAPGIETPSAAEVLPGYTPLSARAPSTGSPAANPPPASAYTPPTLQANSSNLTHQAFWNDYGAGTVGASVAIFEPPHSPDARVVIGFCGLKTYFNPPGWVRGPSDIGRNLALSPEQCECYPWPEHLGNFCKASNY